MEGANILVADIQVPDEEFLKKVSFKKTNLTNLHNCLDACDGMDYVFNLLCVKGSPKVMKERPASYFTPQILFNTCLLEAARQCGVKDYLYTSSVGVYHPAPVLIEDDVVLLNKPEEIYPAFQKTYEQNGSSLIIEWGDYYNEK